MDPKFALNIVDWLEKQRFGPEDFAPSPKAAQHKVEERAPKATTGENPAGKVAIKIYELVRRGGRTFERARTAWVNPDVATRLNQRKVATDWVRTFGNYLVLGLHGDADEGLEMLCTRDCTGGKRSPSLLRDADARLRYLRNWLEVSSPRSLVYRGLRDLR